MPWHGGAGWERWQYRVDFRSVLEYCDSVGDTSFLNARLPIPINLFNAQSSLVWFTAQMPGQLDWRPVCERLELFMNKCFFFFFLVLKSAISRIEFTCPWARRPTHQSRTFAWSLTGDRSVIIGHVFLSPCRWSFGVVLFELLTLGGMPYPTINNRDLLRELQDGYRMPCPDNCSPEM